MVHTPGHLSDSWAAGDSNLQGKIAGSADAMLQVFNRLFPNQNRVVHVLEDKVEVGRNTAHGIWYLCSNSELEIIGCMKKYNYPVCGLLIAALAYFAFSGCQTTASGPSGSVAHLTVQRGPKFGDRSVLAVMVDGARVGSVVTGQSYNGTLSPGHHVISVSASGPHRGTAPTKTITAVAGQSYSFTATWQGSHLVLL